MNFSDKLTELLEQNNLTQAQLAKALKINPQTVSMWKKQNSTPKAETLQKIANYFNVPISYFLEERTVEYTNRLTGEVVATVKFDPAKDVDAEMQQILELYVKASPAMRAAALAVLEAAEAERLKNESLDIKSKKQ